MEGWEKWVKGVRGQLKNLKKRAHIQKGIHKSISGKREMRERMRWIGENEKLNEHVRNSSKAKALSCRDNG